MDGVTMENMWKTKIKMKTNRTKGKELPGLIGAAHTGLLNITCNERNTIYNTFS